MAEQATPADNLNPTAMVESLLSNTELLKSIGGLLGNAPANEANGTGGGTDGLLGALSNPELMAKLPQIMAMLKPIITPADAPSVPTATDRNALAVSTPIKRPHTDCRDDLLLALKPFLSPARCEAVDTIIRLSKLGTVLKHMQ